MTGLYKRRKKWWFSFSHKGERYRISTGYENEADAINYALTVLERPEEFINGGDAIGNLLGRYLQLKKMRGVSDSRRENLQLRLEAFFRDYTISHPSQITEAKITQWMDKHWLQNNDTANEYRGNLAGFTRWLVDHGEMRNDPCERIPRRKARLRVRKRFLSRDECRLLLGSCGELDLKLCIYLSLHCGLRKGECLQVKPHWIDIEAGLLHVQANDDWQPKDADNRTIPLTKELKTFLAPHADRLPYLVKPETKKGKGTYRWDFRRPFNDLLAETEIQCTFHDLRRTFASLHVSAGTSIYKVARWLGDGVAVVEKHYGHLVPNDDEINNAWD